MDKRKLAGLTVVEIMVALAIAAIMMVFALPAFNDFTAQRRVAANVNSVVGAINYARNEAARRGINVSMQAVDAGDDANEWGPGFCVTENPGDCDDSIQLFQAEANVTINGVDDLNAEEILTFNSRGMYTADAAGAIEVCGQGADEDPGRIVRINRIGRVSVGQLDCFP